MKIKNDTAFDGIWALTWRSFVYLPIGVIAFVLLLIVIAALVFPPVVGTLCLCYGLWWQGVTAFVIWSLVIWTWRHFRLRRLFESPRSLL